MSQPPIRIEPYDPRWPSMFEEDKRKILEAVGEYVTAVEHIGSTSIPGLAAKPIIDVMAAIKSLSPAPACVAPLAAIGYEYRPDHEAIMPERRFFRRGPHGAGTHHLHIVERSSEFWEEHILFRDYLRAHRDAAAEYEKLKRQLAAAHGSDRGAYTDAKTDFIELCVERARKGKDGG